LAVSEPCRLLLVDDHPLFCEGLRAVLAGRPRFAVVGQAGSVAEALQLAAQLAPEVMLLDISLPDGSGLEVLRRMAGWERRPRVLAVSMHARLDGVAASFKAGALGYIVKESGAEQLLQGLEAVSRGERYLDSALGPQVLMRLDAYTLRRSRGQDPAYGSLTRREQQVLRLLAEGQTVSDIAAALFISRKTVENHRANICGKLNLKNLAELVHYAARLGLIELAVDGPSAFRP
jgi:DNA-binding NarL/FixJ family response regulator